MTTIRNLIDILLLIAGLCTTFTGLLIFFGPEGGSTILLFGMDRHEWSDWHAYATFTTAALALIHFLLNFERFKAMFQKVAGGEHGSWNRWLRVVVNVLFLILWNFVLFIGFAMWLAPSGSGRKELLWGITKHDWGSYHGWVALIAIGVTLVHLTLNWKPLLRAFSQPFREE